MRKAVSVSCLTLHEPFEQAALDALVVDEGALLPHHGLTQVRRAERLVARRAVHRDQSAGHEAQTAIFEYVKLKSTLLYTSVVRSG